MKKHAGAYLEVYVASELRLGWRVGRIQVCVRVVPACDHRGADVVNVAVRGENLQGSLPAPGAVAALEEHEHARAAGSRSRGILLAIVRPSRRD